METEKVKFEFLEIGIDLCLITLTHATIQNVTNQTARCLQTRIKWRGTTIEYIKNPYCFLTPPLFSHYEVNEFQEMNTTYLHKPENAMRPYY